MAHRLRTHEDYQIGIICALEIEKVAIVATLDETHPTLGKARGDNNQYTLGRIGAHNVVIACLPASLIGIRSATHTTRNLLRSFPIKLSLMVGVGSGVWSKKNDIRLGDIVVSQPTRAHGGLVQYDFRKMDEGGKFHRTGSLGKPPQVLWHALKELKEFDRTDGINIEAFLSFMAQNKSRMGQTYQYQGADHDQLFEATYSHRGKKTCNRCDHKLVIQRPARLDTSPRIHYGTIASGNVVMKHGTTRDEIAKEERVICFEMEAAGLIDEFPCLVIRGICDYADSHKNKIWQPYAAATAAAFARALLGSIDQLGDPEIGRTTAIDTARGTETLLQRPARHEDSLTRRSDSDEPTHAVASLGQPLLPVPHCKMCNILFCLWISLAATSLAVGLWRSFATSDEGKGFTDAAYVVAVGGLVIYPLQNRHASRCRLSKQ